MRTILFLLLYLLQIFVVGVSRTVAIRLFLEGLLIFGIGGMAIVYVLAPFLDGLFCRVPSKILIAAGAVLLELFAADQAYSAGHKGITDYKAQTEQQELRKVTAARRPPR